MKKILFIGQFPPPVHGVSVMNESIINSKPLNESFKIKPLDLKFGKSIKDLDHFSIFKLYKALMYCFILIKEMIVYKPNLVYFTPSPTGFSFYRDAVYLFLIKIFKVKILIHLHGKGIAENIINASMKKQIYTWFFKNTHVICLSRSISSDIEEVYNKIPFLVPNGIKSQPQSFIVGNKRLESKPQILFLSHLKQNKGVLIFIEALSILHKKGFLFNARLVGSPSEISIEELNSIIEKHNLVPYIQITGPLTGVAKQNEYKRADIFVFPTYNDAFPLVILEAMQFGLPVVSTHEGSIPEIIIDNETGFIVEKKRPKILAEKIAILLKDKNRREVMGNNGYNRFMEEFTLEKFELNMLNTFKRVLSDF